MKTIAQATKVYPVGIYHVTLESTDKSDFVTKYGFRPSLYTFEGDYDCMGWTDELTMLCEIVTENLEMYLSVGFSIWELLIKFTWKIEKLDYSVFNHSEDDGEF
jgi:hypothetical protein